MSEYVAKDIERDAAGTPCVCGGFADRTHEPPTESEDDRLGCGRPHCCVAVFRCRICGLRFVGQLNAPDMDADRDWDEVGDE